MSDFSTVSSQSWFSRLGGAIKGVIFGIILVFVMIVMLWWNEGRAVKTYKMLKEGAGAVVSVSADTVSPGNDSKLVHLSGLATTEDTLSDSIFGISATALKLMRTVEMYQVEETITKEEKKKLGGGTETVETPSYSQVWSSSVIDSSNFRDPSKQVNPGSMPYSSETLTATKATIGAFTLNSGLLGQITNAQPMNATQETLSKIQQDLQSKLTLHANGYYMGANPSSPQIGDVRVTFKVVLPQDVSLISQQVGNTFQAWQASNGKSFQRLESGTVSAEVMFEDAQAENRMLTWILRLVGLVLIAVGIGMIFRPLSVAADVLPFLGSLLEVGVGIIAFLGSLCITMLVISMAWIFYRPLIGIPLLLISVGSIVALFVMKNKKAVAA